MIIIVDFGSQTTHLISRRIREMGVDVQVVNPGSDPGEDVRGIILSGGPASVYSKNSPTLDRKIFALGIPVLGICYGLQLTSYLLGGEVKPGKKKEYGPTQIQLTIDNEKLKILDGVPEAFNVWMSHGDEVIKTPPGFVTYGQTETIPHAFIAQEKKKIYGIQFHPEIVHTQYGQQILKNFLEICGVKIKKRTINKRYVDSLIEDIKDLVRDDKAICALSGGVDSAVAALLVHRAIGKNLESVYIDSGLMRAEETVVLRKVFKEHFQMKVKIVNAKEEFLQSQKGVVDPEQKRKIIGKTFIEIFEKVAKKSGAKFLVQGTIYPDVIESAGTKHSRRIKSHHNVGGLPKKMNLVLVEPLRTFYKDEVRAIGKYLGLPESIVQRHPFPGPGLAVRIIGEVKDYKLKVLREADRIVREEIESAKLGKKLWQTFAVFTGIKTTGVRGDNRVYGETIAIRAIEAKDAMSANFAKLPYPLLEKISVRIVNEIKQVNRVVYDITNKPPATMEWE